MTILPPQTRASAPPTPTERPPPSGYASTTPEGRIDVNEFQDRLDRTYQAKTVGELQQLVSDLPNDPQLGRLGRDPRLRCLWMLPWIPLLFVIIAISALAGHHHAGLWVLIPFFFLARFLFRGHRPWHGRRYQSPHA